MPSIRTIWAALAVIFFVYALPAQAEPAISVCFTPGGPCTERIVNSIAGASKEIRVQAYSFTSAPIAKALADAHRRGIDVEVILDKSQASTRYTGATYLKNAGIPVLIDDRVAIAHSKVIIIDSKTVITGSFNFTKAAQERNAENLLVIDNSNLASEYLENWTSRAAVSTPYERVVKKRARKLEAE